MLQYISIMDAIREATKPYMREKVPPLRAGDVVRVHERIREGEKERVQVFEGLIIARKHGSGINATFTVRKIASRNVGVERVFPLHSPAIEKIEILRHEKVRRGKLYYIRNLIGKKTRRKRTTPIDEMFSFEPEKVLDVAEAKTEETKEEATPKSEDDGKIEEADEKPPTTDEDQQAKDDGKEAGEK